MQLFGTTLLQRIDDLGRRVLSVGADMKQDVAATGPETTSDQCTSALFVNDIFERIGVQVIQIV